MEKSNKLMMKKNGKKSNLLVVIIILILIVLSLIIFGILQFRIFNGQRGFMNEARLACVSLPESSLCHFRSESDDFFGRCKLYPHNNLVCLPDRNK